jgi:hypothetical protein
MAAVLACGPGAVLSHFSAGAHWGICASGHLIEVLRQSGGFHPKGHPGVKLHQTRRLEPYEVTVEREVPIVVMERLLLDLAALLDSKRLERTFVQAFLAAPDPHHRPPTRLQGRGEAAPDRA